MDIDLAIFKWFMIIGIIIGIIIAITLMSTYKPAPQPVLPGFTPQPTA